jgi:hypothetical protein
MTKTRQQWHHPQYKKQPVWHKKRPALLMLAFAEATNRRPLLLREPRRLRQSSGAHAEPVSSHVLQRLCAAK